jgi:hypothetical protein
MPNYQVIASWGLKPFLESLDQFVLKRLSACLLGRCIFEDSSSETEQTHTLNA